MGFLAEHASHKEPKAPVWQNANEGPLSVDAVNAMVVSAAHVAGLERPSEVAAETIRHTYITFLVRQGAPIDDLSQIVGQLSVEAMPSYRILSPPGQRVDLGDVNRVYAALNGAEDDNT